MANTRKDRRMDPQLIQALEAQLTTAYDAKGFLGSKALNAICCEMAAEHYRDFLAADMNPGALLQVSCRAQALNEMYARIVAAAQAGAAAQDELSRATE